MTSFITPLAAAALLLAGNAFASASAPVAGEGPQFTLFDGPPSGMNSVQREQVRAGGARHQPVSGEASYQGMDTRHSSLTRAQVQRQTLDAIARGFVIKTGD